MRIVDRRGPHKHGQDQDQDQQPSTFEQQQSDGETWQEYFAPESNTQRVKRVEMYAFGIAVTDATLARVRREAALNRFHRKVWRWLVAWGRYLTRVPPRPAAALAPDAPPVLPGGDAA
jgi:hypothetical protein